MKRILLGLVMVGGLALMAAPMANAMSETAVPALCSTATVTNSYAILITAEDPSVITADGTATLPGAVSAGFGVGVIQFGVGSTTGGAGGQPGCSITTGELIYNVGDIQTNPIGLSFGPAYCMAPVAALGTGIPCFDGGDHMSGNLTAGGPDGSFILTFDAGYSWFDAGVSTGNVPFGFWVNTTLGNTIAVGTSIPGVVNTALPGSGAPVGQIMLEKQKAPPANTTFGAAPYIGAEAISCNANGANTTDFIAAGQAAAGTAPPFLGQTIAGASEFTLGSLSEWNACQAAGSLSFNGNDTYVVSGTGANPNNADCSFSFFPSECLGLLSLPYDNLPSGTTASEFADGTSNGFSAITGTGTACTDAYTAGAGYETSAVQYGATDGNAWIIVDGLFSDEFGDIPAGGSSYCAEYEQSPVPGNITNLTTTTIVAVSSTKTGYVKVTNPTEADCDIEISMASNSNTISGATQDAACTGLRAPYLCCTGSHTGTCVDSTCSLSLSSYPGLVLGTPVDADAPGPAPSTELAQTNCTCSDGVSPANSTASTLTLSSETCPLSGTTSYTVTCKN